METVTRLTPNHTPAAKHRNVFHILSYCYMNINVTTGQNFWILMKIMEGLLAYISLYLFCKKILANIIYTCIYIMYYGYT